MTRTLLFLAADAADDRWITVDEHAVVARGSGVPVADEVVAVAPADAVTLHWAALPARSPAQATAAARIVVADASAAPVTDLHVAVGNDGGDERPIAVVAGAAMVEWLSRMARDGIDPVAMVPAPMLMPAPAEGFIRAEMAGQGIVRGLASGFADEARLTDLLTGGVAPATMDREAIDAALVAGAAAPALDLRQGAFARRRRRGIDWALIRRAGVLALTILGVTLAIDLVRIAKYSFAADALEARAATLAATALPRGATIVDADRQLVERLTEVRGPGLGFAGTVAAAFDAVRGVPGAEITAIDFQPSGALRLSVATTRETEPTELKRRIEIAGFRVQAGTFQSANGRVSGDLTVTPR